MIKIISLFFLISIAMCTATVVAGTAYLVVGGIAVCEVETPEVSLTIPVPTQLADAGLLLARFNLPRDSEWSEMRDEIAPFMPAIRSALNALASVKDGTTLVSVETEDETVLIAKRGGRFHVDVDAPDATVHVSVPARSMKRIARGVPELL